MSNHKDSVTANRREMTRVCYETKAELFVGDKKLLVTESRDISLKGIYVQTKGLKVGMECKIILTLTGSEPEIIIILHGKVVRVDNSGAGILFTLIDIESFLHLQNIVAVNTGDYDMTHQEFVNKQSPSEVK